MAELALIIKDLLPEFYGTALLIFVLAVMIALEMSKAKVNPISAIFNFFGRFCKDNKENSAKLDKILKNQEHMEQDIKDIQIDLAQVQADAKKSKADVDQNEIDRIRWEILSFANSCHCGTKHAREEFDHIFEIYVKYHNLLEANGKENGKIDREYSYLERLYAALQDSNGFINE